VAVVGIPAFALFIVLTAPASFLAYRASTESQGTVQFDETQGTLWSGSARATVEAPGGVFTFDRIAWRLLPARLMEGRLAFDVSVDSREARGNLRVLRGWSEWEVRGGAARVEARLAPVFFPFVAAWRPEGVVSVAADGVRWSERELHGPVTVEWLDGGVALSDVKPLGAYRLSVQGMGESAKLALSTLSGPLEVNGAGEWKLPRGVAFSGDARAQGSSAAALEPLLNLMGPKRPDGAHSIEVHIR
jgi:general secretion pathway protein N